MNRKQASARAALNTYAATVDGVERRERRDTQAADLIASLLLMFEPETADRILERAAEYAYDERDDTTPLYVGI